MSNQKATLSGEPGETPERRIPLAFGRPAKLQAHHLDRLAIVYVRQSSPQQVLDHKESTARQYALVDLAVETGLGPTASRSSTKTKVIPPPRLKDVMVSIGCLPRLGLTMSGSSWASS